MAGGMTCFDGLGSMGPQNEAEEKLLLACSTSDIPTITKLLEKKAEINFECVDLLGRTPLQLAVENEDVEAVKLLLPYSDKKNVEDCLLFAISLSSENLAMVMLKHPRYAEIEAQNVEKDDVASFDVLPSNSRFPTNTTPLILAAENNMYEIVRHLLVEGHVIHKPHVLNCPCETCVWKSKTDHFRFAHERLNAYKGLASESYVSLSSEDPIIEAFLMRRTLLKLSETEEHFKNEYCDLAKQLSTFSVKLLNKVIGDSELDVILNKVGRKNEDRYAPLGRLQLALKLEEKRFVAHPSSQMRMKKKWYDGFEILSRGPLIKRAAIVIAFALTYPLLALVYIFAPKFKGIQFVRAPCAKFIAHVFFYLILLAMLLWTTVVAIPYRPEDQMAWNVSITQSYFRTSSTGAFLIRSGQAEPVHYLIFVWVLGLLWQEVKELYRDGFRTHFTSILNWLDLVMLSTYLVSFGFRFYAVRMIISSTSYFRTSQYSSVLNATVTPLRLLDIGDPTAMEHYNWLNPDRYYWDQYDPVIVGEGLFAIANVLDFARFISILPAFEALGTLQISFGIMMKDIFRFLGLFGLVFLAFMIGLANLYWFYGPANRTAVELATHSATTAEEYFGTLSSTFGYCFWSLFGMGEKDAADISAFKDLQFTQVIGYLLYGLFMICCVIVLLNLLIAMMSLSFSQIQDDADVEWKFSRTQLFFDYMLPGATLPVPLNLIPTPKTVFYIVRFLARCCKRQKNKTTDIDTEEITNSSSVTLANGSADKDDASKNGVIQVKESSPKLPHIFDQKEGQTKYKTVISRIVRRFITDASTKKDDDADDDNVKQDLMRIRREMTNSLEMRAREIEQCRKDIGASQKAFQKDLSVCNTAISRLEVAINNVATIMAKKSEEELAKASAERRQSVAAPLASSAAPLASADIDANLALAARSGTPAPVLTSIPGGSPKLAAMVPSSVNSPAKYSPPKGGANASAWDKP